MALEIPGVLKVGGVPDLPVKDHLPGSERQVRQDQGVERLPSMAELEAQARALERTFSIFNHRLKLTVNEEIDQIVVKVIDAETDKVIKEIPPAEIQRLTARIKETIGLLVDEKR